jgi:hypothetical protein
MDGYKTFQQFPNSSEPDTATWIAVRDTWNTPHGYAVNCEIGTPVYRGYFSSDALEWWPLNVGKKEIFWFPQKQPVYSFAPLEYYEVRIQPEFNANELYGSNFDFAVDTDPNEISKKGFLMDLLLSGGILQITPQDQTVSSELDQTAEGNGLFHAQLNAPVTMDISLGCYSTKQVNLSLDYALSSGASLQILAGTRLLNTIIPPVGPPAGDPLAGIDIPSLRTFKATYNLASMGMGQSYVQYTLKLTGPAGSELYLDNIVITNPNAKPFLSDLDADGSVNLKDFALFAKQWAKSGCISPGYCSGADIDHTGDVNLADLAILTDEWLQIPKVGSTK